MFRVSEEILISFFFKGKVNYTDLRLALNIFRRIYSKSKK